VKAATQGNFLPFDDVFQRNVCIAGEGLFFDFFTQ